MIVQKCLRNVAVRVAGAGMLIGGVTWPTSVAGQDDADVEVKIASAMAAGSSSLQRVDTSSQSCMMRKP